MRFKKSTQLPGAGRTRARHHHGSHTPTSPGAILQVKWPVNPNILAASVDSGQKKWKKIRRMPSGLQSIVFILEHTLHPMLYLLPYLVGFFSLPDNEEPQWQWLLRNKVIIIKFDLHDI